MDSLEIPGLSIAIINDAKAVYHRVLGTKNTDTYEPLTNDNIFDAGSLSKTPFAYLTIKLVASGKLD